MQFTGLGKPPVGVVFDSDMGDNIDAALALALLYGFDGKNEARVVSLSVTKSNLQSAAYCDAVARFYAGAVNGGFDGFARKLPVGMAVTGKISNSTPMLTETLARVNADGTAQYPNTIHQLNDTADPAALIRNAFTAQYDQNAMAVLCGPATNLVNALRLPGVKDLISRKARLLAVACDSLAQDIPAARRLFAEWPGPIVTAGNDIGAALPFPAASIEKDFAWSPAHPIADAYRAYKAMPYDAPASGMAAVLYAVRPQEGYFKLSAPGTVAVLDDGSLEFTASPAGKHRSLIFDPEQKDRILQVYTEVASAKPVPRQRPKKPVKAADKP